MQKRIVLMLVAALVVVLGLLWTLTSLAPNSGRETEWQAASPNARVTTQGLNAPLSASVQDAYSGELPPPPPPF